MAGLFFLLTIVAIAGLCLTLVGRTRRALARTVLAPLHFPLHRARWALAVAAVASLTLFVFSAPVQEARCKEDLLARIEAHNRNHPEDLMDTSADRDVDQLIEIVMKHNDKVNLSQIQIHSHRLEGEFIDMSKPIDLDQYDRMFGLVLFPDSCIQITQRRAQEHPAPPPEWDSAKEAQCTKDISALIAAHDKTHPESMILKNPTGRETLEQLENLLTDNNLGQEDEIGWPQCLLEYSNFQTYQNKQRLDQVEREKANWNHKLNASVQYDEVQLTITNLDDSSWRQVDMFINSNYELRTSVLEAHQTYTVGVGQFAKSDGTRFNPFATKVLTVTVSANTDLGDGDWTGTFD
jgi:hypothetical protein